MGWNKYWSLEHPTRQPSTINHRIFWDCRLRDAETQIGKDSEGSKTKDSQQGWSTVGRVENKLN